MPLLIDLVLGCIGVYWLVTSLTTLTIWKGLSIGAGLLPAVASGILLLLLLVDVIHILRTQKINRQYFLDSFKSVRKRELFPLLIGVGCLAGIYLVGMIITLICMLFAWLKFLSGYSVKKSGLVTICVMVFLYGVFRLWLQTPLPKGLLGIL